MATVAPYVVLNCPVTEILGFYDTEEEASAERVRQMYRAVGNATGVDADKAYKEGNAERAAIKAKIDAERKAILDRNLVRNPVFEAEQKKLQAQGE